MASKQGACIVNYSVDDPDDKKNIQLNEFDHYGTRWELAKNNKSI